MNLREKIEQVQTLLERHPALENRQTLKTKITALNKSIDEFLKLSDPEILRDTREYAELSALVALPENKAIVTAEWFAAQANSVGLKFAKFTKKEKDEVLLELVKSKRATAAIDNLKSTPPQKAQRLLSELANKSADKAEKEIAKMKAAQLQEFCEHNQIAIAQKKKGDFDKKKTAANVFNKLAELREYLKM